MSTLLDQLIETVEAEAAEEQTLLAKQDSVTPTRSKRRKSGLKRILQRLAVLRSLRKAA
jgi:hypothetical protein